MDNHGGSVEARFEKEGEWRQKNEDSVEVMRASTKSVQCCCGERGFEIIVGRKVYRPSYQLDMRYRREGL